MKLSECIERVKKERPNGFSEDTLVDFLNDFEASVKLEVFEYKPEDIIDYIWKEDHDKKLLLYRPYDICYIDYVSAQISYKNQNYDNYANDMQMFNTHYNEFKKDYNRRHRKGTEQLIKNIW